MSKSTDFTIGAEVSCSDGICGELRRVVIDPIPRTLTHLVVATPGHWGGPSHLVPISLVDATATGILLRCTTAEVKTLELAEETHFLSGADGEWDYRQEEMLSWPHYGLGMGAANMGMAGMSAGRALTTYDRVPKGEVQVRRDEHVHATDGELGRVQGLVVDPRDDHVTHVLLDEGHLWGQRRVAIPISAVTGVADGVRLNLRKDEVRDLPLVDLQT